MHNKTRLPKKEKTCFRGLAGAGEASLILFLIAALVFPYPLLTKTAQAEGGEITQTSQTDFQLGTAQNTLELNQSPGNIKLKQNLNTYTETTKEEFDLGYSPVDSFSQSAVSEENGGEIIINQGYTYTPSTSPAIGSNYVLHSFLDSARNLLYVSTPGGLTVLNTQGTADPADDTLVKTYTTSTTPAIANNYVEHSFLDSARNLLYVSTYYGYGGLTAINLDEHYNSSGIYVSQPVSPSSVPHNSVFWEENKTGGQNISVQTRTGDSDAVWMDEFDDGDTSEYAGDYYEWDNPFNTAEESGGTMKLSNPSPYTSGNDQGVDFWFDTGKPEGYFPAGSVVRAKIRVNSDRLQQSYSDYMFNEDWYTDSGPLWQNNTWLYPTFSANESFSKIGFEIHWKTGTWDDENDSFEIDWLSIELPDSYWGEWNEACANQHGCEIGDTTGAAWLQYRLNLSTDDPTSSPSVNSVTLASGYQSSGTFTSSILDAGDMADWQELTADTETPTGTNITFETRTGNTPSPDSSWSDWQSANSPVASSDKRYLQYKATLATTDQNQTPVLKSVALSYSGSSFKPIIAIGKKKSYQLSPDETISLKASTLFFRGILPNLKYGKVEIYQDGQLKKTGNIRKSGKYRLKLKHKKNQTHSYQFRYLNSHKEEINSTPSYTILVDSRKPKFTKQNPKTITKSPGDTVSWDVADNDQIDYYQYTFQGKTQTTNESSFVLPADLEKGKNWKLKVKAFDRAGNNKTRKFTVRIR